MLDDDVIALILVWHIQLIQKVVCWLTHLQTDSMFAHMYIGHECSFSQAGVQLMQILLQALILRWYSYCSHVRRLNPLKPVMCVKQHDAQQTRQSQAEAEK